VGGRQTQLADKENEIQELKNANEQLRDLCVRLQTALQVSSEQLHSFVAAKAEQRVSAECERANESIPSQPALVPSEPAAPQVLFQNPSATSVSETFPLIR
jgi:hypothetical protein